LAKIIALVIGNQITSNFLIWWQDFCCLAPIEKFFAKVKNEVKFRAIKKLLCQRQRVMILLV